MVSQLRQTAKGRLVLTALDSASGAGRPDLQQAICARLTD